MEWSIELILIIASLLLILSVVASKISDKFGIPALLLFLVIGMLAGTDGLGRIYFNDPALAQYVGIVALVVILFSGGLDTNWTSVSRVLKEGLTISTLGVLITACLVAGFTHYILGLPILVSFLLGAIVSSTDAAAVFSVLRSRGVTLRGRLRPLLELESGSNDPMAVFLTIATLRLLTGEASTPLDILPFFFSQALVGLAFGLLMGQVTLFLVNRLRLGYDGLYPVLTFAIVILTYGVTNSLGGSGFLAVYLVGLTMGRADFLHKRSLIRFYDGVAWLMQITMFLVLGLLVFPSQVVTILQPGLLIALALVLVARPVSVFISLLFSNFTLNEKAFVSWVGLRGAVPIVLATYPLLAQLPQAELIFNIVFFVVLISVLLQGTSIPFIARLLNVEAPVQERRSYPIELIPNSALMGELKELHIPSVSPVVGRAIFEMHLPPEFLVILIARGEQFIIPSGGSILQGDDTLLILSNQQDFETVENQVSGRNIKPVQPISSSEPVESNSKSGD